MAKVPDLFIMAARGFTSSRIFGTLEKARLYGMTLPARDTARCRAIPLMQVRGHDTHRRVIHIHTSYVYMLNRNTHAHIHQYRHTHTHTHAQRVEEGWIQQRGRENRKISEPTNSGSMWDLSPPRLSKEWANEGCLQQEEVSGPPS